MQLKPVITWWSHPVSLSSISTAYTALYAAGGPSNSGTMRAIRVVRNDAVIAELDLYDYLLAAGESPPE